MDTSPSRTGQPLIDLALTAAGSIGIVALCVPEGGGSPLWRQALVALHSDLILLFYVPLLPCLILVASVRGLLRGPPSRPEQLVAYGVAAIGCGLSLFTAWTFVTGIIWVHPAVFDLHSARGIRNTVTMLLPVVTILAGGGLLFRNAAAGGAGPYAAISVLQVPYVALCAAYLTQASAASWDLFTSLVAVTAVVYSADLLLTSAATRRAPSSRKAA
jgi:hypothetical protein